MLPQFQYNDLCILYIMSIPCPLKCLQKNSHLPICDNFLCLTIQIFTCMIIINLNLIIKICSHKGKNYNYNIHHMVAA